MNISKREIQPRCHNLLISKEEIAYLLAEIKVASRFIKNGILFFPTFEEYRQMWKDIDSDFSFIIEDNYNYEVIKYNISLNCFPNNNVYTNLVLGINLYMKLLNQPMIDFVASTASEPCIEKINNTKVLFIDNDSIKYFIENNNVVCLIWNKIIDLCEHITKSKLFKFDYKKTIKLYENPEYHQDKNELVSLIRSVNLSEDMINKINLLLN